ncbi:MAG: hypothetical protein WA102_05940 [Candidatus Methanoperedens sp.]
MVDKKIKLIAISILIISVIINGFSISALFFAVLFGLLLIPPLLVFAAILKEGAPLIAGELRALMESGKEMFIISISKESITLEPNIDR